MVDECDNSLYIYLQELHADVLRVFPQLVHAS